MMARNILLRLLYVPLPDEVKNLNEKTIKLMNYKGQLLIQG